MSVSYEYDADGVRVSSTVNGVKTEFLVDKNLPYAQVLEELVNDSAIASYVYGLDLISQERGNADSYYLVDGLGSTRGLANASGVVTDTYTYDAFGNLVASAGGTANNYLFAGEQFDPNLGDYYLRQRYYDNDTGRFTRRDTYEGSLFSPITLHKYLYGNANPVAYTDPSGLFSAGEAQAAANIANTLAGIQWESGQRLIFATLDGEIGGGGKLSLDAHIVSIAAELVFVTALMGAIPLVAQASPPLMRFLLKYLLQDYDLVVRAMDIHSALGEGTKEFNQRVTAVARIEYPDGRVETVVDTSMGYLTPAQTARLAPGERVISDRSGITGLHAEERIVEWASLNNGKVGGVGTSRPICPDCRITIIRAGGRPVGRKLPFPTPKRRDGWR